MALQMTENNVQNLEQTTQFSAQQDGHDEEKHSLRQMHLSSGRNVVSLQTCSFDASFVGKHSPCTGIRFPTKDGCDFGERLRPARHSFTVLGDYTFY